MCLVFGCSRSLKLWRPRGCELWEKGVPGGAWGCLCWSHLPGRTSSSFPHLPTPPPQSQVPLSGAALQNFRWGEGCWGLERLRLTCRCCLQINMTHYIRHLSFGEDYPGIVNPLDRTNVTAPQGTSLEGGPQLPKPCPALMPSALFSLQPP